MERKDENFYTWKGAEEHLRRLGEANSRATQAWLACLDTAEGIRIFEDLCRGIPEVDVAFEVDDPPLVLSSIWRF